MKTAMVSNKLYWLTVVVVLIFAVLLRIKDINRPLLDAHYFRQTQTATVVKNFYLSGIDFIYTKLDIFGDGRQQVLILEFPFFQAVTALASNILGLHDYVGRLVSMLFGIAGGITLLLIVNKLFTNKVIGIVTLVFFIFNPLNFYFQQAYLIESTVIFLHLLSLYLWIKYTEAKRNNWMIFASIITAIASVQKNVYAPFLFIPILSILFIKIGRKQFVKFRWLPGILFSILILLVWQYYTDLTNLANGHSNFTLGDQSQRLWNFGTLNERFDIRTWIFRLNFIQNSVTKLQWPVFMVGIFLLLRRKVKEKSVLLAWLSATVLYYLVLFRIQSHDYYFMLVLPVFSIIAAYGLIEMFKLIKNKYIYAFLIGSYLFLFAYKSIQNAGMYFRIDDKMLSRLNTYNSVIKPGGNILFILQENDWNSVYSYYTGHKGIIIAAANVSAESVDQYSKQGYRYAVIDSVVSLNTIKNNSPELLDKYDRLLLKDDLAILAI